MKHDVIYQFRSTFDVRRATEQQTVRLDCDSIVRSTFVNAGKLKSVARENNVTLGALIIPYV